MKCKAKVSVNDLVLLVQNIPILLTDNMSTRKTVQLSPNTYNELVKMGDLNSSFDSVIANLIKIAKQQPQSQI
jgi:hypothetical protein